VLDDSITGTSRANIGDALSAEGVMGLATAYQNLHLLPMYQQKMAYGSRGFPWTSDICRRDVSYAKGICPVAETLQDSSFLGLAMCMYELTDDDVDLVVRAFRKVWNNLPVLAEHACNAPA
jgi:dTDP-4-amino-4,6-dideoxygalactose transaminase